MLEILSLKKSGHLKKKCHIVILDQGLIKMRPKKLWNPEILCQSSETS